METRISSKGQIVLPAEMRRRDRIKPGEKFSIDRVGQGEYRLVRQRPEPNQDLVDWLLACPVKDFFVPIDSESTDSL